MVGGIYQNTLCMVFIYKYRELKTAPFIPILKKTQKKDAKEGILLRPNPVSFRAANCFKIWVKLVATCFSEH